jgi:hypothetical protein
MKRSFRLKCFHHHYHHHRHHQTHRQTHTHTHTHTERETHEHRHTHIQTYRAPVVHVDPSSIGVAHTELVQFELVVGLSPCAGSTKISVRWIQESGPEYNFGQVEQMSRKQDIAPYALVPGQTYVFRVEVTSTFGLQHSNNSAIVRITTTPIPAPVLQRAAYEVDEVIIIIIIVIIVVTLIVLIIIIIIIPLITLITLIILLT